MKKKQSFTHCRSSYFILPSQQQRQLKSPTQKQGQLPSPFPPHVHRFLFSGREINLCDQRGIAISHLADNCESTRYQLDLIQAKLDRKERGEKRMRTVSPSADTPQPYHLNEAICASLNDFAGRNCPQVVQETVSSRDSEIDEELGPLPPASPLLRRFLGQEGKGTQRKRRVRRGLHSVMVKTFSQPRRGSHPGILGTTTVSSPSHSLSAAFRSSCNSPLLDAKPHHKQIGRFASMGDLRLFLKGGRRRKR